MKIKQVRVIPSVNLELEKLIEFRRQQNPHLTINKQSVVADLILKATKKEVKDSDGC